MQVQDKDKIKDKTPMIPPEQPTTHNDGETSEALKMKLIYENLQTKRESLDIRQTYAKHWLETRTSSEPSTSFQDLVKNRLIKLGKAEGALKEVNNMLTATNDQRSKTKPTNTIETDDLKRLDKCLQDRRRDLVTRHKTSKFC